MSEGQSAGSSWGNAASYIRVGGLEGGRGYGRHDTCGTVFDLILKRARQESDFESLCHQSQAFYWAGLSSRISFKIASTKELSKLEGYRDTS